MINGIFLIDKPKDITSFDVIRKLRKITGIKKIGHSGTLDPFATGLMQVCTNKATKIIRFLTSQKKTYVAVAKLGIKTETADITGKVIERKNIPNLSKLDIDKIQKRILNISEQVPPNYSALKVDGRRAFVLARKNIEFKLEKRAIKIYDFKIININYDEIEFEVTVSKGTYIRTLSETLSEILGTVGTTKELRRTKINRISVQNAISLEKINSENWQDSIKTIEEILIDFPKIYLAKKEIERLQLGQRVPFIHPDIDYTMVMNSDKKSVGFAEIKDNVIHPRINL